MAQSPPPEPALPQISATATDLLFVADYGYTKRTIQNPGLNRQLWCNYETSYICKRVYICPSYVTVLSAALSPDSSIVQRTRSGFQILISNCEFFSSISFVGALILIQNSANVMLRDCQFNQLSTVSSGLPATSLVNLWLYQSISIFYVVLYCTISIIQQRLLM